MEHSSHHDLKVNCEYTCGNVIGECDSLNSQDFVNHQNCFRTGFQSCFTVFLSEVNRSHHSFLNSCKRVKYGDLKELFEQQVYQHNNEGMLNLMNVMCGNIEIKCGYAIHFYSMGGDQQKCFETCHGQNWDAGDGNYVEPCAGDFSGDPENPLWKPLMENNKVYFFIILD